MSLGGGREAGTGDLTRLFPRPIVAFQGCCEQGNRGFNTDLAKEIIACWRDT